MKKQVEAPLLWEGGDVLCLRCNFAALPRFARASGLELHFSAVKYALIPAGESLLPQRPCRSNEVPLSVLAISEHTSSLLLH